MADTGTITMSGVILPDKINKKINSKTASYEPANNTEGWYYKLTNVTTSAADLISGTFLNKSTASNDTGSDLATVHVNDIVKFIYIEHEGVTDDLSSSTNDSIYITLDGTTADRSNASGAIEIKTGQSWFGRINTTVGNIHAVTGVANLGGVSGIAKVNCVVAAIIDDVA